MSSIAYISQDTPSGRTVPDWSSLPVPQRHVVTALPVNFARIDNGIMPPYWWNGGHGETVEAGPAIVLAPLGHPSGVTTNLPGIHTLGLFGLKQRTSQMMIPSPPILPEHDSPNDTPPPPQFPEASSSSQIETPVLRGATNHQLPLQSKQTRMVPEQDSQPANARSESRRNNRARGIAKSRRGNALTIHEVHYDVNGNDRFGNIHLDDNVQRRHVLSPQAFFVFPIYVILILVSFGLVVFCHILSLVV